MLDFEKVVSLIREKTKEGRELIYKDGEVGITSLLSCPLKVDFRKKYPDITSEAVEIDDGYVWEGQVKFALQELYGDAFREELELPYECMGVKIRGHLDCGLIFEDRVVGIELKSPRELFVRDLPEDTIFLYDDTNIVRNNPHYYTQAKVQKYLLSKLYPDKEVEQYLFYKAPARRGVKVRKLYVAVPIKEDMTDDEFKEIVWKFKEERVPRWKGECEYYCPYYKAGVCEGKDVRFQDTVISEEAKALLKEYRALQSELKNLEFTLKKLIKGSFRMGERELGWVEREVIDIDIRELLKKIEPEKVNDYLQVKWQKKKEIEEKYGDEVIKERRKERVWRL